MFTNASNVSLPVQAPPLPHCVLSRSSLTIFLSFAVTTIVVVSPCCLSVWILGLRHKRQRRSATHSDVFTYHLVAMEMVSVVACVVFLHGFRKRAVLLMYTSMHVYSFTSYGQVYFHILTCVDRYVAVVHPVAYLRLKDRAGLRVRNALLGCAWLLFALKLVIRSDFDSAVQYFYLSFSIAMVSSCNFAVLYVLLRPPPGERVHVSQSKRRAFKTIMVILSVLLFRILTHLSVIGVYESSLGSEAQRCAALVSGVFFSLPSSLVLPLLFLYRAKVLREKKNTQPVTATSS